MAIQITNNIATLDIDFDGNGDQYSIHKPNITLEKSGDTVVIVDSGRVPAKEYKVLYTDVTPVPASADALYATILGYLNNGGGGDATAGNQLTIISELQDVNTELDNISATDFATSAKQEEVKTKLDSIITNTDTNATEAKQDTIIGHVDGIEGTLTSIDGKDFATSVKQEDIKAKLDSLITNTSTNSTEAKQDTQITNQEDIISKLASLDSKTYDINPKIDESPQELLRLIHAGIDIMTEQQMLTNNLLKLILS
jgi:ribosomal protein L17